MAYKDPQKQLEAQRRSYEKNREKRREYSRNRAAAERIKVREWIDEYKASHPCVDCGEDDPIVLEFDHLGDKSFNIADAFRLRYSIERIEQEIEKCDVRCANCHRRVTYQRRNGSLAQ